MEEMIFFRKNALLANLCKEWDSKWAACHNNKEKLVRLVLMQQSAPYFATFCYQGKGLTKEYCKREFSDFINGRIFDNCDDVSGFTYSIYVDAPVDFKIASDVTQMLWCNNVNVEIPKTKCPIIYISNNSDVHLTCDGYNSPKIYLFDNSKLIIDDADDTCDIVVYSYGGAADVEIGKYCTTNKIHIFPKELRL